MTVNNFEASEQCLNVFACPTDYRPSRFFRKYNQSFVPPIYHSNLSDIKRETGADAPLLWGWTFDQLADSLALRRDAQEFGSYVSDRHQGAIPCAASKVSEVFKSAYLRVLEALASSKLIDAASLRDLAAIVCPVDLSLWNVGSIEQPEWWPRASGARQQLPSSVDWQTTESLILKEMGDGHLVLAEGPLSEQNDHLQSGHFRLLPFAYRVIGKDMPTAEQIFYVLNRSSWSIDSAHHKALSILQAPMEDWIDSKQDGIHAGDLLLLPMLAHIETININCWQSWRGANPLMFPTKHLSGGGLKTIGDQSWSLINQGKTVFKGFSWLKGPQLKIRFDYGLCGQFATLNYSWLDEFLGQRNLKLAFVLKHDYRVRESQYHEYLTSSFAKLLNFSTIITTGSNR
jgi:hypothetical protein